MTEERRNKIAKMFLLNNEIYIEELKNIDIQEVIFLIYSAKYFKDKGKYTNINFDQKIQAFEKVLKYKIKHINEFYIAYDRSTNYPYIDSGNRAWIFSREEYADMAEGYFSKQLISLNMKRISRVRVIDEFANLHRLGIKKILIDNGQYSSEINSDDALSPVEWNNSSEAGMPIVNPELQFTAISFFQKLYSKNDYEGKNDELNKLKDKVFNKIISAKYLLPTQLKEKEQSYINEQGKRTVKRDSVMEFAHLMDKNNKSWIPIFTDWVEFEQAYDKSEWSGNAVSYDDVIALCKDMEGVVINCNGICFRIDEKNKEMIESYRKDDSGDKLLVEREPREEIDTGKVSLEEPEDYPSEMIKAVKKYMKKEKDIYEAYLRLMVSKSGKRSYLIIVDFDGNKNEIFDGIADAALPYLDGMLLDIMEVDDWAEGAVTEVEPFYTKKRFGIF